MLENSLRLEDGEQIGVEARKRVRHTTAWMEKTGIEWQSG